MKIMKPSDKRDALRSAVSRSAVLLSAFFLSSFCSWCLCGEPSSLDPGLDRPYQLQVVLDFSENRFLTPIFQDQVERDLRDQLRQTYGPLAEVEVVRRHPLLREVQAKGLQQALDAWEELSEHKTHFVLIDYVDGRYKLQARQHDGGTGLSSPLVRQQQTIDRRLVARLAALLINSDFGLVGTVLEAGTDVRLAIQGGKRGTSLGRWLKKGDIFAVVRLHRQGSTVRSTRLPWAILQVAQEPRDGECRCRFFHRFEEDRLTSGKGILGYRGLQIATTTAPVRLRLIDDQTFQPLDRLRAHLSRDGFSGKARELTTDADGLAATEEAFANVAFVRILSGNSVVAQFPVPLVDERTVVCRVRVNPQTGLEALEFRKDLWVRRIYDDLLAGSARVAELNDLLGKSLPAALERARQGAKNLHEELNTLELERDQLIDLARQLKPRPAQLDLREGQQRLEELQQRQKRLAAFITQLEAAVKEAGSKKTQNLRQMLERARLLENLADFDQAIAHYEKFLAMDADQAKVKSHLEALKKSWAVRTMEHGQAREFLLKAWPRTEVAGLKAALAEAKKAFAVCKKNGDALTPRKLPGANLAHAANLHKRLDTLKGQDTEDNRAEARALVGVAQDLMQFHRDVNAFLTGVKK